MSDNNKLIEPMIFDEPDKVNPNQGLTKFMDFDVRTKSIEEKLYIILYRLNDSDDEIYSKTFSICIGRTEAYNDIKDKLISGVSVDIHRSKIITETKQTESETGDRKYYLIPYEECISIYSFCTSVREYYSFDDFDIEDYNDTEVPEDNTDADLAKNPRYMTKEQQDYMKMLEASMSRDKFIKSIINEKNDNNSNI